MMHDQNFKNLILDYPRQAIALFAASEAQAIKQQTTGQPLCFFNRGRHGASLHRNTTPWKEVPHDSSPLRPRLPRHRPWCEMPRDSHPAPPANRQHTRHQHDHPHRRRPLSDTTKVFSIGP